MCLFFSFYGILYADESSLKSNSINISGNKYTLQVEHTLNPKVGYVDLNFQITETESKVQKNNYKISVVAEKGEEKFKTFALNNSTNPNVYKCVFDLEKSGQWIFKTSISEDEYEENIEFSIYIEDRNRETSFFSLSSYLFAVIFLIIFLAPLYIFRKVIF